MGKIVFLTLPAHGHTNPTLPLVKELISRGERVLYYTLEDFRKKAEETGAEFRTYRGDFSPWAEKSFTDPAALFRAQMDISRLIMETLPEEIEREAPDCIVHDSLALWGRYVAARFGIPAVCSNTTFVFSRQNLPPPRTFLDRLRVIASLPRLAAVIAAQAKMERECGIGKTDFLDSFMNKEPLTIVFTSAEFQPHAERLDASYRFVGPSLVGRSESGEDVIPAANALPVVYISLGTINNRDRGFYEKCFRALANRPVLAVVSLGTNVTPSDLPPAPANFILKAHVPQLKILSRTAVFVTHGGMNSVHEGLWFGVPLVVVPQTNEQAQVAGRVAVTGTGLWLKRVTPASIRSAVDQAMTENRFRENSRRLGESFRAAGGSVRAADEIMAYYRRRKK